MPASWRGDCHAAGAACRRGRRKAVSVTAPQPGAAQDDVIFNEPGRQSRCRAGRRRGPMPRVHASAGYGIGAALQITSLVRLPDSHPSCQPSAEPEFSFAWPGFVWASRASASAVCADSSVLALAIWRSVGVRAARAKGAECSPARRLMAEVSAHCVAHALPACLGNLRPSEHSETSAAPAKRFV